MEESDDDDEVEEVKSDITTTVTSKTRTDSSQAQESHAEESCAKENEARTYTRARRNDHIRLLCQVEQAQAYRARKEGC